MAWYKILFKGGGVATQILDALVDPAEAGYGSDIVRAVDESAGDSAFLRKLHVPFTRLSASSMAEDVAQCSWHLAKNVADNPDQNWLTADYTAAEARFNTWWTSLKPFFPPSTALKEYRWYLAGPARPISGPPIKIASRNIQGTGTQLALPPQISANISEHTRIRKHWGRFYLPAGHTNLLDTYGRIAAGNITSILAATVTLYNGLRADGMYPVIYSSAKPARTTKHGIHLPAAPARAYVVEELRMDDVFDVIRSRRFSAPIAATTTVLT